MSSPDSITDFKQTQIAFAAHLRDPENQPAPSDVEDRRMAIYRGLIYNNIEGFIRGGFPILRKLFSLDERSEQDWHELVRDFIRSHKAHTPYFLEIGQEFLHYLQNERTQRDQEKDPPFLLELAHYEWVELALDVSTETFPDETGPLDLKQEADVLESIPVVSPLAWNLSYQFPVHLIGPEFLPQQPPETPTFLVVYRNREDEVKFMEGNAATSRLITLLDGDDELTGRQSLEILVDELKAPDPQAIFNFGKDLIQRLHSLSIVAGYR